MCLTTNHKEIKEAETEIECYKVIKYSVHGGYRTPCVNYNVGYSVIKGESPLVAIGNENVKYNEIENNAEINTGFIHVFKTKYSASLYAEILDVLGGGYESEYKVFKCTIPKGTKYYEGHFSYFCGNLSSYAAKFIMLCEEIDWKYIIDQTTFSNTPGYILSKQ